MKELVFGRRYRATEKIGSGGMADVYKAVDDTLGRTVAVKVMHARFAADPSFAARFRQEAQAAANLGSPNIVNMYDWGQDGDTPYIVMEYVRGNDLKSIIEQRGALPSRTVAEIGAQVCSALSVAHGYDIIHRDIKPHNIMVQPDGAVKVMDFGIARAGDSMNTQTGSVLGTAHYISPEQAQGRQLSGASDLYSLGVVLYEAATGRVPFDADTPVSVALKQVNEQAIAPHVANPDIDPALEAVIVKAMQKQTSERYVSADDLGRDLRAVAQGRPVDAAVAQADAGNAADAIPLASAAALPSVSKTSVMPSVSLSEGSGSGERRKRRATPTHRRVWPWVVVALLLVAVGAGVALRPQPVRVQSAPVPDIVSMTRADAKIALQRAGFVAGKVTEKFSTRVKTGRVISQSPASAAVAPKGSTVEFAVSKGPETVRVPNVVGLLEADARNAFVTAGLAPEASASQFNGDVPSGTVSAQVPGAGGRAFKGSVVNYTVSLGAEPGVPPGNQDWKPGKSKGSGHRD